LLCVNQGLSSDVDVSDGCSWEWILKNRKWCCFGGWIAARENVGARFGTVSELTKAWQGTYFALLQLHSVLVATTLDWKN
jgi:hypothetical protein